MLEKKILNQWSQLLFSETKNGRTNEIQIKYVKGTNKYQSRNHWNRKKDSKGNQWNKTGVLFFFVNINNIDNSLARFMKKIREKTKISYINERSDSPTYSRDINRIISECYEKLYANKFIKWDEVNKFLERCHLSLKKI